jgi:hypothetical protein
MNRLRKILLSWPVISLVAAVCLYTLTGFFLAPYLVRHYLPEILAKQLGKKAAVGEVRINPYKLTLEVEDFTLDEPDGQPIAGFKRLSVDFESKSIIDRAWTFRRLHLAAPQVNLVIEPGGALNLARLVPPSPEPGAAGEDGKGAPPLVFEKILLDQGRIDFTDRRQSKPAAIRLDPLRLEVGNLSTLPGRLGPNALVAATGDGGTIRWSGNIGLNPVVSSGRITIEGIRAATLAAFARDRLNLGPPEGTLGLSAEYELDLSGKAARLSVQKLGLALGGLALKLEGAGEPFLELPDVKLSEGRLDLAKRQVELGRVAVAGGRARLAVDASGALNLVQMAKAPAAPPAPAPAKADPPGTGNPWKIGLSAFDLKGLALDYRDQSRTPGLNAALGALQVHFKAAAEAGGGAPTLLVEDIAAVAAGFTAGPADGPEPPLRIDALTLEGGAFDLAGNAATAARIAVEGGALDVRLLPDGTVNLARLFAAPEKGANATAPEPAAGAGRPFRFAAGAVSVTGLGAAFTDISVRPDAPLVNLDDFALTLSALDGSSPVKFDARLRVREGGEIKAAGTFDPNGPSVESEIQVADLGLTRFQPYLDRAAALELKSGKVSTAGTLRHGIPGAAARTAFQGGLKVEDLRLVEPGAGDTFLGWKTLEADRIELQIAPNRLGVDEVRLAQPAGKFIIAPDRSLNVVKVIKSDPAAAPSADAAPFPVRVRKVTIADGKLDFADLSLTPQFATKIHELRGVVAGIASTGAARAQVSLEGRVDEYGTARIKGELNGSDPKAFTDLRMVFRNVEMKNLSPYTGKFAGRRIDFGKLSLDLKYQIEKSRLAGENQIVVERLKLGERVASPEAVDLPLDLAVALLEDSNGVIEIGLPVQGNLDAPEFDYSRLVGKAISGLLGKIVTSPFRALGALIPGRGEEALSRVLFEPGESDVPPPEKEKLVSLAEALRKRPQLKLLVQGRYHPADDLARLRQLGVRRALAARLGAPVGPQEDPGPADFGSPETLKALESMFTERFDAQALAAAKAEHAPAAAPAQAVKAPGQGGGDARPPAAEDPARLAKALFRRMVETEAVPEAVLLRLAEARARAVAAELSTAGAIPAERIEIKPAESLGPDKKEEAAAAALSLVPAAGKS